MDISARVRRISAPSGDESSGAKRILWPRRARSHPAVHGWRFEAPMKTWLVRTNFWHAKARLASDSAGQVSMAVARYRKNIARYTKTLFRGWEQRRPCAPCARERASMCRAAAWLEELGLGQYAQVFAEQSIDFSIISDLTEGDLEKLGILLGHRKRMLKAIAALAGTNRAADTDQASFAPPHSSPERRQPTLLFCDLVGSTALASELDPEDAAAMISNVSTCPAMHLHQC
jgi:hypothetical protein